MKICHKKLANAVKYQNRTLTMDDNFNKLFGTDFYHWAIVRKLKQELKKSAVSFTDAVNWLSQVNSH